MHSRFWRLAHVLALGLIGIVAPGCPSAKASQAPVVQATVPLGGATVGRAPLIVFQFDREMDPAFLTTSYISFNLSGTNTPISSYSLEVIPALNEVRIIPGILLTVGQAYDVFCLGTIQSAKGTQMGSAQGITITVEAASIVTNGIATSLPNPSALTGAGATGTIDMTWTTATETQTGGVPANVNHYDVYISTSPGTEDYLIQTPPAFQSFASLTGATLTGLTSGTLYYMKVLPRDDEGNVLESSLPECSATAK